MMFLQTFTLIISLIASASLPTMISTHSDENSKETENFSGYCDTNPDCTCIKGRGKYTVHCSDLLDIMSEVRYFFPMRRNERGTGIRNLVSAHCNLKASVDSLENFSLLEMDRENEVIFDLFNCHIPTQPYASLFPPKNEHEKNVSIYSLYVECGSIPDFPITADHLTGLQDLLELSIECIALHILPQDLLRDVPKTLKKLSITKTSIETIPDNFFYYLSGLEVLYLSNNKLKNIFEKTFLGLGDVLNEMDISYNSIRHMDDELFLTFQQIDTLDIRHNEISELPKSIGNLSKLRTFSASYNMIKEINAGYFDGLKSLITVELHHNQLLQLPSDVFHGNLNVFHVELNDNYLGNGIASFIPPDSPSGDIILPSSTPEKLKEDSMSLPEDLFSKNVVLRKVFLEGNRLTSLPEKIFYHNLELNHVILSYNRLSNLPKELFASNKMLNVLDLSNNFISELPDTLLISQTKLIRLNLSKNKIKYLGKDIFANLKAIENIYLNDNLMETLHDDIFSNFKEMISLRILGLHDNFLAALPNMTLPHVQHLRLDRNKIVSIGKNAFSNMESLVSIDCSNNLIEDVQKHAFYIDSQSLRSINLANNKLISLSEEWFKWSYVMTNNAYLNLNFSGNSLDNVNFTQEMKQTIYRTEILDLSRNNLTYFGKYTSHGRLTEGMHIRQMDLSHNKIASVDSAQNFDFIRKTWGFTSGFEDFYLLEVLNLAHNELNVIPMDWRNSLPRLRLLDLSHNRIKYLWHQDLLFSTGNVMGLQTTPYIPAAMVQKWTFDEYPCTLKLTVDLSHNLIEGIELPHSILRKVPNECNKDRHYSHATLLLGHNPFHCDCQIFNILRYAAKEIRPVAELERNAGMNLVRPAQIDLEGLGCSKPLSVRGKQLSEPESWIYHLLPLKGICSLIDE